MPDFLKILIFFLVIPLLYSCQRPLQAQEKALGNQLAYTQAPKIEHTKHVRKKQRKICDRLQKIRERLEKERKRKKQRKGGK